MVVKRITLFNFKDEDIETVNEAYKKLEQDNKKGGRPYILSLKANKLYDDPRSNGYRFAAESEFSSVEDMKYYDEECEAHTALKNKIKPLAQGKPMTIYWEAGVGHH